MENQLRDLIYIGSELLIRDILKDDKYKDKKRLEPFGFKGNSQTDEAGIIQEIFKRIGTTNKTFIEFGVGGKENENNTWHFLKDGWNGVWFEGSQERVDYLSKLLAGPIKEKRLRIGCNYIYPDNVNKIFTKYNFPQEIDMLNIDIDSIDYWVWKNIDSKILNPRVVIIEYNAKYPPPMEWIKVNNKNLKFDKTDSMGSSLKSLELLGKEKGYSLVGCGISGANAYFVRNDLLEDHFCKPYTAENHYQPARYYICKSVSGKNYDYSGMKNSYCAHVGKDGKLFS